MPPGLCPLVKVASHLVSPWSCHCLSSILVINVRGQFSLLDGGWKHYINIMEQPLQECSQTSSPPSKRTNKHSTIQNVGNSFFFLLFRYSAELTSYHHLITSPLKTKRREKSIHIIFRRPQVANLAVLNALRFPARLDISDAADQSIPSFTSSCCFPSVPAY